MNLKKHKTTLGVYLNDLQRISRVEDLRGLKKLFNRKLKFVMAVFYLND